MPWGQQIKSLEKILEKRGVIREIRRSSAKDGVAAHIDVDFAAAKGGFHSTFHRIRAQSGNRGRFNFAKNAQKEATI